MVDTKGLTNEEKDIIFSLRNHMCKFCKRRDNGTCTITIGLPYRITHTGCGHWEWNGKHPAQVKKRVC